jgi:hypothetical protein
MRLDVVGTLTSPRFPAPEPDEVRAEDQPLESGQ